jgi:serine/threonine protein kinase
MLSHLGKGSFSVVSLAV